MSVIRVPFNRSLVNVSLSRDAEGRTHSRDSEKPLPQDQHSSSPAGDVEPAALRSLQSIEQLLQSLDGKYQQQFRQLNDHLAEFAKRIAKQALGSDNALLDERVTTFAEALLRQVAPDQAVTFFVNPACVAKLESWTVASERRVISIQGDATVQPGDCRIETAEKGFLASLDAFLDAASNRNTNVKGGS